MSGEITESVAQAIEELRADFEPSPIEVEFDGDGGARVIIEHVELGPPYAQKLTWIGAQLPAQLPYSDVYPLFVRADISRIDENALGKGMSSGHKFMSRAAVQLSRRSNGCDLEIQSPAMKFLKVLHWMRMKR